MKKQNKNKLYEIDKGFYSKLALYFTLLFLITFLFIFALICFVYIAGIDLTLLPDDVCDDTSKNFNAVFCFLSNSENSDLYYFFYNTSLIMLIFMSLSFIILNVFYIANKFYFKKLLKEKSCGAVIYKIENEKVYFLTLRMGYGHTSICKGHQEKNETDEETALREIKEETNLDVNLNTDFVATIKYKPNDNSIKDVIFFLATPKDNSVQPTDLHDEEVAGFEWCDYEETQFKITHASDREVIKKAYHYIKKHNLLSE